ncbi:MAG: phospholipid carrier-dependent glycosyltransferase [Chloroflexi bacterium]|nr:phospholipid carrier-dependent glycosyltransferase [Chloroflexota bacterium]
MDRKTAFTLILGLLTASGIWLLKISTPSGLGLIDDAISYIAASRALLNGQGFTRIWLATATEAITHWPPFFSFLLATISRIFDIDPYRSARVLNTIIFGANAGILALLGYKMTRSQLAGVFLSLLFLSNSALLRLHAQALSEPLYIFIGLLAFLVFVRAFEFRPHPNLPPQGEGRSPLSLRERAEGEGSSKWLILAGFLAGLSYLTRYAGLSLLATFIVAILILRPNWQKPFRSLAFFLVGAIPPILVWMIRNKLVSGSATNRALAWHPVTVDNAQRGLKSFFSFIVPSPALRASWIENYSLLAIILSVITLYLLFWLIRSGLGYFSSPEKITHSEIIPFITTLYIFSYMGSLLISLSFFDAATPLNDRILSPVYISLFVIFVYFIHRLSQQGKIASRIFAWGFALFLLGTFLITQVQTVKILQESPHGFASWRWRESPVLEAIRNLPDDVEIHTNQPTAVYFWTDRPVYRLWDEQPESLRTEKAVLAIFFPADDEAPEYRAWFAEMTEGLTLVEKSGLGNLYRNE